MTEQMTRAEIEMTVIMLAEDHHYSSAAIRAALAAPIRSDARRKAFPRNATHSARLLGCRDRISDVRRIAAARDRMSAGASRGEVAEILKPGLRARRAMQ